MAHPLRHEVFMRSLSSFLRAVPSVALLPVVALATTAACSETSSQGSRVEVKVARSDLARDRTPNVDAPTLSTLVSDDTAFGLDLYGRIASGKSAGQNLFMSSHSVSRAFAMLSGAARGKTAEQIASTFRFTLPQEKLHPAMNKLALELESRASEGGSGSDGKGFRLNLNNSFWGEQSTAWEKPYLDLLAVNYDAGIQLVDFVNQSDGARKTINAWTEEKTESRIKDLLPDGSLDPSTRFVLVNTVYFNAAWVEKFAPTTVSFQKSASERVDVPALHQTNSDFRYGATDDAEIVSVPYEGRKLEFLVVLPKDIAAFEAKLDGTAFQALTSKLAPALVDLTMPKIKIDGQTISLQDELKAMGLSDIFGGGDFSGMTKTIGLTIDDVYHQAFVKIDEKGTEAAAATAIVGRETSAPAEPPKKVVVDKPYLFFVRDVPTGTVLFTGRVILPTT